MQVSFFQPAFLWALPVVVMPVAIHLLFRGKTKKIAFSSLRFLHETVLRTNSRRNLQRILLLVVRILLLVILVLLFARPFNRKSQLASLYDPGTPVYWWVDPTVSMSYGQEMSLRSLGKQLLDSLAANIPSPSRIHMFDSERNEFASISRSDQAVFSTVVYGRHGLENALDRIETLHADNQQGVLFVVSDFQSGDEAKSVSESIRRYLQTRNNWLSVCLLDMSPQNPWNYTVEQQSVHLPDNARVNATVGARGKELDSTELNVETGATRIGSRRIGLAKNKVTKVSIPIRAFEDMDRSGGAVNLSAEDPLQGDNTVYFAKQARHSNTVLIIGDPQENLPLATAFGALDESRWSPVQMKAAHEVGYADLDSADLIILGGVAGAGGAQEALFTRSGMSEKSIVFFPGFKGESTEFTRRVMRYLGESVAAKTTGSKAFTAVLPDTLSALWKGFPRAISREVRVYEYLKGIPGKPLVYLDNGNVLTSEKTDDQGNTWILFASPIGATTSNNLCETGFYLPLVDRVSSHALSGTMAGARGWIAGEPGPNPVRSSGLSARIYDNQDNLVGEWSRQPWVVLPSPGVYRMEVEGALPEWIVANVDPFESSLEYAPPDPAVLKCRQASVIKPREFGGFLRAGGTDAKLRQVLWSLLAILLLVEMLFWLSSVGQSR